MLSIAKLNQARVEYLETQLEGRADDYYAETGHTLGEWYGSAAAILGLAGKTVERGQLGRMIDGAHPATGDRLRRPVRAREITATVPDPETGAPMLVRRQLDPVGGFDLTFGAPKSVSLAYALAGDSEQRELVAAHQAAVRAALGVLDREGVYVRLGAGGAERVRGAGILAALFDHRLSREVVHPGGARTIDPHLHTHCAVANTTQGPDGRWRTISSRVLLTEYRPALGSVYRAALRHEVTARLGWSWRHLPNGLSELAGWTPEALREMSQRRIQVEEALADAGASGWRAAQEAAWATRERKTPTKDLDAYQDQFRVRLAEHGMGRDELERALAPSPPQVRAPTADQLGRISERLSGPDGLTGTRNTFRRADALQAWADALPHGAEPELLLRLTDRYLQSRDVVALDDGRYTTRGLLACERVFLEHAAQGRHLRRGVLRRETLEQAVAAAASSRRPLQLTDEQQAVLVRVATSGHAVEAVIARAGTGKTSVAGVLADAYRRGGHDVVGVAPTGRAARELAAAGVPSSTLDALVLDLDRNDGFVGAPPRVVLIDEAGMAGTRLLARLAEHAQRADVKLVLIGDTAQLAAVTASGAYRGLVERHGAAQLTRVLRQYDAGEVAALQTLRADHPDPDRYLAYKAQRGELHILPDASAAVAAAVETWAAAVDRVGVGEAVLICRDNALRERLCLAQRARLAERDMVAGEELLAGGRRFAAGDRVVTRENNARVGVDNGTRGTVLHVDADARTLRVRTDDGRDLVIPAAYLTRGLVEYAYTLTGHGMQGATVEHATVVSRPEHHSRQWTYTASSRAREATRHLVISDSQRIGDPEHQTPQEPRNPPETMLRLLQCIRRDDDELLAHDHAATRNDVPTHSRAAAAAHLGSSIPSRSAPERYRGNDRP